MIPEWGRPLTMQSAAVATGNGNALVQNNYGGVNISITGTFSATVTFEASDDLGTSWFAVPALNRTTGVSATTATAPGLYWIALPGIYQVRARVSTYVSGNVTAVGVPVPLYDGPREGVGGVIPTGTNSIGGTKDDGPFWTSVHGVTAAPVTSADASAGVSVTDVPTSGQKIVVTDIFMSSDTALNLTFKCETSGAIICGPFYMAANSSVQVTPRSKAWKLATANKKLQVFASGAGAISIDVHYYSEA